VATKDPSNMAAEYDTFSNYHINEDILSQFLLEQFPEDQFGAWNFFIEVKIKLSHNSNAGF
jgi:hypothetical protein